MTLLSTRSNKLSGVLAYEEAPEFGYCRADVSVVVESGMDIGAVVARTLISGSATATAGTNTGNGTVGTITVSKFAQVGNYKIRFITSATNAGDFTVANPEGILVGHGKVGVVCTADDLSFTIADGSTDFAVGDTFTIAVAGTVKYEWIEAADVATLVADVAVVIDNDADVINLEAGTHTLAVLTRGPSGVVDIGLQYKASLSDSQEAIVEAALKAKGILVHTGV
jgi:hypothetical protein